VQRFFLTLQSVVIVVLAVVLFRSCKHPQEIHSNTNKQPEVVTVIKTQTKIKTTAPTIIKETVTDTVYLSYINMQDWITGTIEARKDSTTIDLQIKNEYSVQIGREKHFFKKDKLYAEVTNKNPFTEIETIKTYDIHYPKRQFIQLGTFLGVSTDLKGNISPVVGVGVIIPFSRR